MTSNSSLYCFLVVIVILVIMALTIMLWLLFYKKESFATKQGDGNPLCQPLVDCRAMCQPTSMVTGAWSSIIGCGDSTFSFISLASALPQSYQEDKELFFSGNIQGDYDAKQSAGKTKYLISIGGSNATVAGWSSFLHTVDDDCATFYQECKKRGITGMDIDIENFEVSLCSVLISISTKLRRMDPTFIIMYTILLGTPAWFAPLLVDSSLYDVLVLMLYNGGMYIAEETGGGCDWDQWAELFLSKGTKGCQTPLFEDVSIYAKDANLSFVDPTKIMLGLITDTPGLRLDASMFQRATQLVTTYGALGIFFWVIPGWAKEDNLAFLSTFGYTVDPSSCKVSETCPLPSMPCDGSCSCVSTACGRKKQGVTDAFCQPCPQQTYWPCDQQGFCECKQNSKEYR